MSHSLFENDFNLLSFDDLLKARDLYHVHLLNKKNVVATAIGRYRIRKKEEPPLSKDLKKVNPEVNPKKRPFKDEPRTLQNSEVRMYSWPCVMVFVNTWEKEVKLKPEERVPTALYLPDGKIVPVCVIQAPLFSERDAVKPDLSFPKDYIGGGYPVITDVQETGRIASIGCLVTDGHFTYAVTNKHVAGEPGTPIYSIVDGIKVEIGKSVNKQIGRVSFEEIYDNLSSKNTFVNMDVGLIEINDLNQWTAQVYGLGELGKIIDVNKFNISLKLIGAPLKAFGCASGEMHGEICGLFYRYKSLGGSDYISDILIGPADSKNTATGTKKTDGLMTHPGDSGTIWVLDSPSSLTPITLEEKEELNAPLAIQWGGHVFSDGKTNKLSAYALASFLSNACNILNVDIIRNWNTALPEYWGAVGHYAIAHYATRLLKSTKLKKLIQANLTRISFEESDIRGSYLEGLSKKPFVPLANVPDLVWKIPGNPHKRSNENPNHFADMDKKDSTGKTLLQYCKADAKNISVTKWMEYYTDSKVKDSTKGCLPFRVWQIFSAMVKSVENGNVVDFVAAAGILSHYVGDAAQPLHISFMYDGIPIEGTNDKKGEHVHSYYEKNMVEKNVDELKQQIVQKMDKAKVKKTINTGKEAAKECVALMDFAFQSVPPKKLIQEFVKVENDGGAAISKHLWLKFGTKTSLLMARSSELLASLWESAWSEGKGNSKIQNLDIIDEELLSARYKDANFIPSKKLAEITPFLL